MGVLQLEHLYRAETHTHIPIDVAKLLLRAACHSIVWQKANKTKFECSKKQYGNVGRVGMCEPDDFSITPSAGNL